MRQNLTLRRVAFFFILTALTAAQAQETVIGVNLGIARAEKYGLYLDDPINRWANREVSFILGGEYLWKQGENFMLGGYGEIQTLNLNKNEADGFRWGAGLVWIGSTNKILMNKISFDFGGYGGLAFAFPQDLDTMFGADFGIFLGPSMDLTPSIKLSLYVADSYGWYHGDKNPAGMQNVQPYVRFQVYFKR